MPFEVKLKVAAPGSKSTVWAKVPDIYKLAESSMLNHCAKS
jgi:hypothetical protein